MTRKPPDSMTLERLQRRLGRLPRPAVRQKFRDRLRGQFVCDVAPERGQLMAPMAWPRPIRLLAAATLIAVAVLILGWRINQGPAWKLTAISGSGVALLDGRAVALDSMANITRALKPGSRVLLPAGAQLDFELPGLAVIQIVGGTDATLPGGPGRWFGRSMTAWLAAGEIRISTAPAFHGIRLSVVTPEVRALVTGTTLAVIRQPGASCVCVLEGKVAMLGAAADDTVHAGFRRSVYRDGSAPFLEPIRPMETMKLTMLRDQAIRALKR